MRQPLVPVVFVLLIGVAATGSAVVAAGHGPGDDVTVEGTVTGVDGGPAGDAVVLIGDSAALTERSPEELRDLVAAAPENVTVVGVDGDGRFETTVAWRRADGLVALSDRGISDVVELGHENATVALRLYERRPQTVYAHLGGVPAGERHDDLLVSLVNNDNTAIETLTLTVESLPEGWSVATVRTNGTYDADDRTVTWRSVAPGGEIDTTVVLRVPEGAEPGEYTVELRARSDTHRVHVGDETVEVLPEDTPGPTTTPVPRDGAPTTDGGTPTRTPTTTRTPATTATSPDRPTSPGATDASGPGVGAAGAVAALALAAVVAVVLGRRG